MKTVMVFGSFDLLHEGHRYFFSEAKKLGERLVVVVALDSTIEKIKRKKPLYSQKERLAFVKQEKAVDVAVLGFEADKMRVVKNYMPNIIALGYDQDSFVLQLQKTISEKKWDIKLVRISAYKPEQFKSSLLKQSLVNRKK